MRFRLETCVRIAEIAGALAFVVSVIYLAAQITSQSKLLRSQAHFNALQLGQRPLELVVENDGLADIVQRCSAAPAAVTAAEWLRCQNYFFMSYNAWEYFYYQHDDDSIPKELWGGADEYFRSTIAQQPGYGRAWRDIAVGFDEPFKSYVDQQFASVAIPATLQALAEQHAAAWSSGDPARVASDFTEDGSLIINGGAPSVGRAAIAEAAHSFMAGCPDMIVTLDRLEKVGDAYRFHWQFVGTNTGPGGTGRTVRITGHEEWTMAADERIAQSLGNHDAAEWDRQLGKAR